MTEGENKVVVVTGGAAGIGLGIVEAAREAGWKVGILDLPGEALEAAGKFFAGGGVHCHGLDITDEAALPQALDAIEADLGPLSGVVNCAGIGQNVPFFDTTVAQFRKMLDVNVIGSFIVAREAASRMRERGGGAIVNITSVSGLQGSEGRVAYGASKGAVNTMTRIMAVELAPLGIRVNTVAPGPVDTPMAQKWHDAATRKTWVSSVPMRRYGLVSEIAGAAVYLLDDKAAGYVNGQTLAVDGGLQRRLTAGCLASHTSRSRN